MNYRKHICFIGIVLVIAFSQACGSRNNWENFNEAGKYANSRGDFVEAERQWIAARAEAERLGPQDPRLATSLSNLAELYRRESKYTEAEELNRRALGIWDKDLSRREDPIVAQALNGLALTYDAQGKYAEAEPLFKRSLAIREKVLGPEHPVVAESLENYGAFLHKAKRDSEAIPFEERAKAIRMKNTPPK